jgi:VWFA-related protein
VGWPVKRRAPSRRRAVAVWILAVASAAGLTAQQAFRGGTELVRLTVTVLDGNNRLVAGLDEEDFQIFEDSVRQDVANFSRQPQPTALSLVIDTSVSMEPRLAVAQGAAIGFVKRLGPNDLAQVLSFDSTTKILIEFTQDKDALERAIRRTEASGSTSLYNALYTSLRGLVQLREERGPDIRRQAIVLLSDGQDTDSETSLDSLVAKIGQSAREGGDDAPVRIFAIAYGEGADTAALQRIAEATGGQWFDASDAAKIDLVFASVINNF